MYLASENHLERWGLEDRISRREIRTHSLPGESKYLSGCVFQDSRGSGRAHSEQTQVQIKRGVKRPTAQKVLQ
jgi:hypothetical protein